MALDSWRLSLYHTQLYPMGYLGFIATVLAVNVPRLSSSQSSLTWVGASSVGPGVMVMPWLIVVVAILILMFRRFKSTAIPIAMNYSAVISAACHPPPDDIDVAEIQTRCCRTTFTSKDVVEPRSQFVYYSNIRGGSQSTFVPFKLLQNLICLIVGVPYQVRMALLKDQHPKLIKRKIQPHHSPG
jgi:hypothetical protein